MTPPVPDVQAEYRRRCGLDSDIREFLPLLHGYARVYPGCRILEVGVRDGHSTVAFLAAAELNGGHVWSVDIDDVLARPGGAGPWAEHPAWTFTRGDSTHPSVVQKQPFAVDVVFLDGDHGKQKVLDELAAYMPRVAPGGVALLHDTRIRWPGEPEGTWPVSRALDEYCGAAGLAWAEMPGNYGLGVIVREW
jgi:predicted O-methyltransferase YrrM